jgi:hypothetical protein
MVSEPTELELFQLRQAVKPGDMLVALLESEEERSSAIWSRPGFPTDGITVLVIATDDEGMSTMGTLFGRVMFWRAGWASTYEEHQRGRIRLSAEL